MVVRLDLEDGRQAVADVNGPGILARTLEHPGRVSRQLFQQRSRVLVAASPRRVHAPPARVCWTRERGLYTGNGAPAGLLSKASADISSRTRQVFVQRCASSLDELDAQEQTEVEATIDAQAGGAMDVIDWSAVFEADPVSFGWPPAESPSAPAANSAGAA